MAFAWHPWSPVLLLLDGVMLLAGVYFIHGMLSRIDGLPARPNSAAWRQIGKGAALTLLPWVVVSALLGGILGMCLLSRTLWTLFTLGLPLLGAVLRRRWRRPWLWALIVLPLALKLWGEAVEPRRLEVERLRLPVRGLTAPVRIVHLSDLQTDGIRGVERKARAAANAFQPDLVLFTGDILNHPDLRAEVGAYLDGFKAAHGRFFVSGNVDNPGWTETFLRDYGWTVLDLSTAAVRVAGGDVALIGMGLGDIGRRDWLESAVAANRGAAARLLISHLPDAIFAARGSGVDLVLAGHTHGGQVSTPFGPVITMSRVPRRIAAGGLHAFGDLKVLVSRGLGWEGHIAPRVRLFSRPHIILLELVPDDAR